MRVLRVPCTDPAAAERAATHLREQHELDVDGTDGRHVLVPAGFSAGFVWALAEVTGDYCEDAELAAWATDAAGEVPAR